MSTRPFPIGSRGGSAVHSPCGLYRYALSRHWGADLADQPCLLFVMLNPSTADDQQDDPTIRKCIGFAQRWGFLGLRVVNLFAFRATKPVDLRAAGYPVGAANDFYIQRSIERCHKTVICAWGVNARGLARPREVLSIIRDAGGVPHAIELAKDGTPCHPLMLPYSCADRQPIALR